MSVGGRLLDNDAMSQVSETTGTTDFLSDCVVLPAYGANSHLREQVVDGLKECLYLASTPNQRPKIIIYRTGNRPGPAFQESVIPIIEKASEQNQNLYLIVASKVGDKDISEYIPDHLKDNVVQITIKNGELPYHIDSNKQELSKLAKKISEDFRIPTLEKKSLNKKKIACFVVGALGFTVIGLIILNEFVL